LELVMETQEECRRRAEDGTRLARLMSNEVDRRAMLAAARRWAALAEAAANRETEDAEQRPKVLSDHG